MSEEKTIEQSYTIGDSTYTVTSHFGSTEKSELLLKLFREASLDDCKEDEL